MTWLKSFLKWIAGPQVAPESLSNYTPRAQQVFALSRKEAERLNDNYLGTGHVLLGMARLGQGVAVNVLQRMGLTLYDIRLEVEKQMGARPDDEKTTGNFLYAPRVKRVLALAQKEAAALHHNYVGTEHILLGILQDGSGVAAKVLRERGISIERTRQGILKELDPNFDPGGDAGNRHVSR